MGKEATSWEWLRDGIAKTLPQYSLLERVENGIVDGMADVNYVIRGSEGWIELKAAHALPKRKGTPVLPKGEGVRLEQINWHMKRQVLGGNTWFFVSVKPYRWLISGAYARLINEWDVDTMTQRARVWSDKNWKPEDWKALVRALEVGT